MAASKPTATTVTLKHLAASLAEDNELSKKQAEAILGGLVGNIVKHLKKGERIDQRQRARIHHGFGLGAGLHHARADSRCIPRQPHDAVRLVPPQIRLHQGVCEDVRVLLRHSNRAVNTRAERHQMLGCHRR